MMLMSHLWPFIGACQRLLYTHVSGRSLSAEPVKRKSQPPLESIAMKTTFAPFGLTIAGAIVVSGCTRDSSTTEMTEGVILSVEYRMEDGHTGGFTRVNDAKAVPGGNGSWNIDARGRLTSDFLFVTRPQRRDLGTEIIPVHRLVSVRFGDGGIQKVNENQPKPGG